MKTSNYPRAQAERVLPKDYSLAARDPRPTALKPERPDTFTRLAYRASHHALHFSRESLRLAQRSERVRLARQGLAGRSLSPLPYLNHAAASHTEVEPSARDWNLPARSPSASGRVYCSAVINFN